MSLQPPDSNAILSEDGRYRSWLERHGDSSPEFLRSGAALVFAITVKERT